MRRDRDLSLFTSFYPFADVITEVVVDIPEAMDYCTYCKPASLFNGNGPAAKYGISHASFTTCLHPSSRSLALAFSAPVLKLDLANAYALPFFRLHECHLCVSRIHEQIRHAQDAERRSRVGGLFAAVCQGLSLRL